MEYPILCYPDPKKGYTVFTDASGIGWSGVLTQEYPDEKGRINIILSVTSADNLEAANSIGQL